MKKLKVKNINKFVSFIIVIVLIIVALLITIISKNSRRVTSSTDISSLDGLKYSDKILAEYEKEGKKDEFLNDYNTVQNAVAIYMLENSTLEKNSFENIVSDINIKLNRESFDEFGIEKPKAWNGKWSVDNDGNLKFKFSSSQIEPSWVKDENIFSKIVLN